MQLVQLKNNEILVDQIAVHFSNWFKKNIHESKKQLTQKIQDPGRELFVFKNQDEYIGFAEVQLESECFPDEDLPEVCLKVQAFYIEPSQLRKGFGSGFFQLLKIWGHDQKAAFIEMEVPVADQGANAFLQSQGLELIGRGEKNGYRSFL